MTYTNNISRSERIEREGNIPGSIGWILKKNNGVFPNKSITRNTHKFTSKLSIVNSPNFHEEALNKGWVYEPITQTWTHPSYGNTVYPSIYQTLYDTNTKKAAVPFHNNEDEHGLAYYCTTSACGKHMKIKSNKWLSEEFDTRHGRRRELWRYKKEMRKKYALQYNSYKDGQRENDNDSEGEYDEYDREFSIEK